MNESIKKILMPFFCGLWYPNPRVVLVVTETTIYSRSCTEEFIINKELLREKPNGVKIFERLGNLFNFKT